jgi:hypothetical protein
LAIFCPACPQPGINLPEGWEKEKDQSKYIRSFVMDGNFKAEHMNMKNAGDDVSLSEGTGFMVKDKEYKEHIRVSKETKEVCHDLGS